MTEDIVLSLGRDAIYTTVMLSAPLLIAALVVGLIVSIIQAVTQINEATLTFIPKMLAIIAVLIVMAPWMTQMLTSYTTELFTNLPNYVR
ncbi:MAG: flagellar biosynthesis protein FliQ [Proteobacteria bacterium]|nr:MAG: flagellar biosynthesis protein FliQ [Pseudomonadota bacterium]